MTNDEITTIGERLYARIDGAWIPIRWWAGGRRLVLSDLDEPEREARRMYLRVRYIARKATDKKDRKEELACTDNDAQAAS